MEKDLNTEYRLYDDGEPNNTFLVLWNTANIVKEGRVLIKDHEGHAEVEIEYVLTKKVKN